jgi:hypothetical protein
VLHIEVHKAELVGLEAPMRLARLIARRQAVQPFGLEDAVDRVAVQVRQEVGDHEGEVIERKACRAT